MNSGVALSKYINENKIKINNKDLRSETGFTFEDAKLAEIRRKIEFNSLQLKDIDYITLNMGVKTQCNNLFVVTKEEKIEFIGEEDVSYIRKVIGGKEIDYQGNIAWQDKYLIELSSNIEDARVIEYMKKRKEFIGTDKDILASWDTTRFKGNTIHIVDLCKTIKCAYSKDYVSLNSNLCIESDRDIENLYQILRTDIESKIYNLFVGKQLNGETRHNSDMRYLMVPNTFENITEFTNDSIGKEFGLTSEEVAYLLKY